MEVEEWNEVAPPCERLALAFVRELPPPIGMPSVVVGALVGQFAVIYYMNKYISVD